MQHSARVSWSQALAWRMERQLLGGAAGGSVADVVRHLAAVQAQVASSAELAIRLRRESSHPGDVGRALASGAVLKTWAVRGALHLLTPDSGAALLSLMASGRPWERPAWVTYFGLTPATLKRMREVVHEALDGKTLTREELIQAIAAHRALRHLADELRSGWGTLLKPLAWQGDLCFGPSQGTRVTFQRPDQASRLWRGLPDAEEAAPIAISAYLRAYGPSTAVRFGQWLAFWVFRDAAARRWFKELSGEMAQVEVDGESAFVLAEDLDELVGTRPSGAVRLLPGFDQWVLGPGTRDAHVVPPARRRAVSRQSGWIAPTVVVGGVVAGTWKLDDDELTVEWFKEAGRIRRGALSDEAARLGSLVGRELRLEVAAG